MTKTIAILMLLLALIAVGCGAPAAHGADRCPCGNFGTGHRSADCHASPADGDRCSADRDAGPTDCDLSSTDCNFGAAD